MKYNDDATLSFLRDIDSTILESSQMRMKMAVDRLMESAAPAHTGHSDSASDSLEMFCPDECCNNGQSVGEKFRVWQWEHRMRNPFSVIFDPDSLNNVEAMEYMKSIELFTTPCKRVGWMHYNGNTERQVEDNGE